MFIRYAQELILPVRGFESMMIHGAYAPGDAAQGARHD